MDAIMKKLEMLFVMILLHSPCIILGQNDKDREMKKYDFGEFTMEIPSDCKYDKDLCKTSGSSSYYISPSKDFIFILFDIPVDENFNSTERLIGEAAGMDLDAKDNIAALTTGPGKEPLYFTSSQYNKSTLMYIAVTAIYEKKKGFCIFIFTKGKPDRNLGFNAISSFRLK